MPSKNALGLEKGKVRLVDYDPNWPKLYQAEKTRIEKLLADKLKAEPTIRFEHVGSTAIPDILSKPILDILIGCNDRREASEVEKQLIADGAELVGPLSGTGMNLLVMGDPRTFHYHVTRYRGEHWYRVLRIRDHLRRHRGLALQYEALKQSLAEANAEDRVGYTRAKIPFLRAVDRRALAEIHSRTLPGLFSSRRALGLRAWEGDLLWVKLGQVRADPAKTS